MAAIVTQYPFDPTGVSPNNLVTGEQHTLVSGINRVAIPNYGAFYSDSMVVTDNANGQPLTANTQYFQIMYWDEASAITGKEVMCGIVVTDPNVSNDISLTYQVVGGVYSNIYQPLVDLIATINIDERTVVWGDLLGTPDFFPPAAHLHDLGDLYGFEYLVDAVNRLRDAVNRGNAATYEELRAYINSNFTTIDSFITNHPGDINAHPVATSLIPGFMSTVDKIKFDTFPAVSAGDVTVGSAAKVLKAGVDAGTMAWATLSKAEVGLSEVMNYGIATQSDAEAGVSDILYMTPLKTVQSIAMHEADTAGHPLATALADGFMSSTYASKLDGIEAGATADQTAAEILALLLTVDGSASGVDADLLDGQHGSYYLAATSYTASDVLTKIKTVDGAGSGLDSDLLDGQHGSYYLPASSYTAADVLAKLKTVDGSGSGLSADNVDGINGADIWHTGNLNPTTFNAVGSYAWMIRNTISSSLVGGSTYAGSGLRFAGYISTGAGVSPITGWDVATTPSGTWRAMGTIGPNTSYYPQTLCVRIS